ncbi:MAG: glucose 1-dehydrogenase [Chloroflexi bacterium]|nr:glucose 1-dehydrogenase [Chloroflexota bacterium]
MKLQGKVVLITGAGSGIGRATAALFVQEGAQVVAADLNPSGLESLAQELEAQGCPPITVVTGDVSRRADAEKMVETAVKTYGTIDIVVNNAGIMDEFVPLGALDDALWRQVLSVNLDGPMYISRKALETMLAKGKGVIVNIASIGGLFGGRAGASYTTSKHALIGLTRSIAYEYAMKGIRCNAICPGGVATNISVRNPDPLGYERLQTTLGMAVRAAEPEELARVALFLASDDSSFVNGEVLVADGGWTVG